MQSTLDKWPLTEEWVDAILLASTDRWVPHMDFRFTAKQKALRREFQEFFADSIKDTPLGWIRFWEITHTDEGWA